MANLAVSAEWFSVKTSKVYPNQATIQRFARLLHSASVEFRVELVARLSQKSPILLFLALQAESANVEEAKKKEKKLRKMLDWAQSPRNRRVDTARRIRSLKKNIQEISRLSKRRVDMQQDEVTLLNTTQR